MGGSIDYSLKPWNTFGITRYANNITYAKSPQQLLNIWQNVTKYNQPVLILGEGSNVLFLEDFAGTVIINRIKGITISEDNDTWHLHTGAGENWHQLVQFTLRQNMPGLENLALIPGRAGSSPIQNIGAYGVEFERVCEYVDCIELTTGKVQRLSAGECCFGYRDSIFKNKYQGHMAIVAIGLCLRKVWQPVLTYGNLTCFNPNTVTPRQVFDAVCHIRMATLPDPKVYGNAGSFFKNPIISSKFYEELITKWPDIPHYFQKDGNIKLAASWLIDKCRLKGVTQSGAAVYRRQALVIINKNNATSEDIIRLARLIRQRVGERFNVWLEPEVRFISSIGEVNAVEMIT